MCAIASISFLSNLEIAIGRVRSNAAPETDGSSVLSGMRFLCAEDNALNDEILEAILEMYPTARSLSRPSRWSSPANTTPS